MSFARTVLQRAARNFSAVPQSFLPCGCLQFVWSVGQQQHRGQSPLISTVLPFSPFIQIQGFHESVAVHKKGNKSTKKSKKGKSNHVEIDEDELNDDEDNDTDLNTPKEKKGKKAKDVDTEHMVTDDQILWVSDPFEDEMDAGVDKFRVNLQPVIGRVGKVSAGLLDSVKVILESGTSVPLTKLAVVSTKGGRDLIINVYEPENMKEISQALYEADMGLTPNQIGETSYRVTVPKPDLDSRQKLVKEASALGESARSSIRKVRGNGLKVLQKNLNEKDSKLETKKFDEAMRKRISEVDEVLAQAKKVLLDG